jgi:hypothetical protein
MLFNQVANAHVFSLRKEGTIFKHLKGIVCPTQWLEWLVFMARGLLGTSDIVGLGGSACAYI